jgi:hypothetical protein
MMRDLPREIGHFLFRCRRWHCHGGGGFFWHAFLINTLILLVKADLIACAVAAVYHPSDNHKAICRESHGSERF